MDAHEPAQADDRDPLGDQQDGEDRSGGAGEDLIALRAAEAIAPAEFPGASGVSAASATRGHTCNGRLAVQRRVLAQLHHGIFTRRLQGEVIPG
jgi:hypothetical protein